MKFLELLRSCKNEKSKKKLLYYRCATDIKLFAKYYFAHYCSAPFNIFHEDSFRDYKFQERGVRRAGAAPRGSAKSTIKAFIKPIHDVCYELEKFIVIISNTEPQAKQKLKDIRAEFLANDRLIRDYGNMLPSGRAGETDFVAHHGNHACRFLALGSKTEIRGIRFGDARPSKIILDDFEHSQEVENEAIREKYQALVDDVISKIGTRQRDIATNLEVVGTVLHRKAVLVNLLNNPRYHSRQYKAIISWADRKDLWNRWKAIYTDLDNEKRLEDARSFYEGHKNLMLAGTKVLWPEVEDYYTLQEEIIENGMRSFMKEKQNEPQSDEEKVFDPDTFRYHYMGDGPHPVSKEVVSGLYTHTGKFIPLEDLEPVGVIDPATGQTTPKLNKKSDFACILWGYAQVIIDRGRKRRRLFVAGDHTKRISPTMQIKKIYDLHEILAFNKFGVETNLYRNLMISNMRDEQKRREREQKKKIRLSLFEIEQVENKHKRIYSLEPRVSNGWISFDKNGLSQEFHDQMLDFPKAAHDDAPDSLEMLWSLVHNRYQAAAVSTDVMDR